MTTSELIAVADKRLLTVSEQAQLIRGLWKGTGHEFAKMVNRAYATAKRYDAMGGSGLLDELDDMFNRLGSSDFRVLYKAVKI